MGAEKAKPDVFQAVADPTRREMLKMLGGKEMSIASISSYFPISRTAVAKHLRILSEAGLVSERKSGRETLFTLQPEPLTELQKWLQFFELYWENKLSALKRFVEEEND
ncbi:ArsR/SmtB family transcription factor [Falsibacillus pallidus]|uniref:ArsR family transcriptional regulator n=1 Tax=Falsibacillus pallidus TaxID=493781 RepID=A0A370GQ57_9BACI|nr:metalloregulator ArsR/SmtB family transcription factor [Falsibacillus pallidus]RDI45450.1 ArsR family transcriptional regulator [Falsibacillus pallidus]